ncbi:MAG TPA: YbdK family carboxylate-amine ligase [Gammaproteobacteria bacterium]
MKFTQCSEPTLGMETEWQLVGRDTLDLVSGVVPLIDHMADAANVTSEYMQSAVELNSPVCNNATELRHEVQALVRRVQQTATDLDMRLLGAGTHPFSERLADVTPSPRYRGIEKSSGYVSYEQLSFAAHVHIGMPSGDDAMRVICGLIPCLPALIAVSANSPFYRGADTDFASYRLRVLAQGNRYVTPPYIHTWQRFCDAFSASQRAGIFKSIKDAHWHIRPQPDLGTIEVRIMDAQFTVTQAAMLAAFVRALAVSILRDEEPDIPATLPWWLEMENRYRASQHGMNAQYIMNERGETGPLRELVAALIEKVFPVAESLGDAEEITMLQRRLDSELGYHVQREWYADSESLRDVVSAQCDALEQDTDDDFIPRDRAAADRRQGSMY